ncbi:MAG: MBL fold metallo-hydrolase [Armatimonadota bacterium]
MATLHLLGTGVPTPAKERFGTAYVLDLDDEQILIDCGPATAYKMVRAGLWPTDIDYLFFTHHHFDHNAGFPAFFLSRWDQSIGEEKILDIYGPEPTAAITEKLFGEDGAFVDDWTARVNHPTSHAVYVNRGGEMPRPAPEWNVTDLKPGDVVEEDNFRVTAGHAEHVGPWLKSLAFRVETDGGTIFFAGDTEPCEQIAQLSPGSDVFMANCWNHQEIMDVDGEGPAQTGTMDAAKMASEAGAAKLILTHTGADLCKPGSMEKGIADIGADYDGTIIFGQELMDVELW